MPCTHEKVRCTDGIFYCLLCGARIDYPPKQEEIPEAEEKPAEAKIKASKRKTKKEAENNG